MDGASLTCVRIKKWGKATVCVHLTQYTRCYLPYLLFSIYFLIFQGQLLSHCHVFYAAKFFIIEETIKAMGMEISCASSGGSVYEDIWRPSWHTTVPRFLTDGHSTINMPGADLHHRQHMQWSGLHRFTRIALMSLPNEDGQTAAPRSELFQQH